MTVDAAKILSVLFAAYPIETRNIPGEQALVTARLYARMLADLDADSVLTAIHRIILTSERLPTVARIRQEVVELNHGPARAAGDAWGEVRAAMSRYGYMAAPGVDFQFADPLVGRVVAAMGWRRLCESDNATADRARFCELYEQVQANERTEAQRAAGGRSALLARAEAPRSIAEALDAHRLAQGGRS